MDKPVIPTGQPARGVTSTLEERKNVTARAAIRYILAKIVAFPLHTQTQVAERLLIGVIVSHRCLTLAALIGGLALTACGQSGGRGATFKRTLGLGGRTSADALALGKGCIDVQSLKKQIAASSEGATLHSRDYDIGRPLPAKGDHQLAFQTVKDKASRDELARRSFTGENAPVLKTLAKASDALDQSPAKELLDVTAQDDCRSIKFSSGDEFKVTFGSANFVTMTNVKTGEVREYSRQRDSLVMTVFTPASIDNCNGGKTTATTERISTRLAWGKDHETLSLVPTYAQRLGVEAAPKTEKFKTAMSALPKKSEDVKCGQ